MSSPLPSSLGTRITALRKQFGRRRGKRLTQRELADKIGVSRESVIGWEADHRQPTDENVEKLAALFETTSEYLLFGSSPHDTANDSPAGNVATDESALGLIRPFKIVGERIEARRHQLKLEGEKPLSQQELADRIGAHVRTVENWENGYRYPAGSLLRRLTRELKVTADELFRGVSVSPEVLDVNAPDSEAGPDKAAQPEAIRPRSVWTRVLITFRHDDLALFDQARGEMPRSVITRELANGLVDSGVKPDDIGGPSEVRRIVARGLQLAMAERDRS